MRETLVVKYIDLDREILPKKLGREQGNANKDMNVKWAIYRGLVANNLLKSFLMFSLIHRKTVPRINCISLPLFV